jgi:hypothetical protein
MNLYVIKISLILPSPLLPGLLNISLGRGGGGSERGEGERGGGGGGVTILSSSGQAASQ